MFEKWKRSFKTKQPFEIQLRLQLAGDSYRRQVIRATPLHNTKGEVVQWVGVDADRDDQYPPETLQEGQNRLLEMVATAQPLPKVLRELAKMIEHQSPGMLSSVLLADETKEKLQHAAAPTLPSSYTDAIDGMMIQPGQGSCGTAAYTGQQVVAANTYKDPRWEPFRALVRKHQLAACWSTPIQLNSGELAGTFAMYYQHPREPSPYEQELTRVATHLAQIAIERQQHEQRICALAAESGARRQAEAAEQKMRRLVEDVDAIIWEMEVPSWEFTFVSRHAEEILGYPPEQWLGNSKFWANIIHPDDRDEALQYCQQATKEGRHHEFEYRALTADGQVVWLRDVVHVVTNEEGTPQKLRGVMVDITKRKQAKEAQRKSEQRFRATFEQAAVGIAHVAPNGQWLRVNNKYAELLGYSSEELSKLTFQQITHPDDRVVSVDLARQLWSGKREFYALEKRYIRKDGSPVWVNLTVTTKKGAAGTPEYFIAVVEDISERKAAEQAHHKSEQRFRAVTENAIDVIATVDAETKIKYISPSVVDMLGYQPNNLAGQQLLDFVHPQDLSQAKNELSLALQQPNTVRSFTVRFKDASGSVRHLSLKVSNLIDRPGIEGILLNIRDVTQAKQHEAELVEAKEEAEKTARLRSNLLANLSHEIRTPLTSILGLSSLLASKVDEKHQEDLQMVEQSGQRLMDTLNTVLLLAQIEGDELTTHPQTLNVSDAARDVCRSLQAKAAEKELSLTVEPASSDARAYLDPDLLDQMLNALVSNAIKFTPEGDVTLEVAAMNEHVHVHVRDTGIGISEAFMPQLFAEFKQESTGYAREYEGTGLGLAITKRLAELSGGSISVESTKGKGSTFTLTLPQAFS